jgi:rhodanese-related sulfurtransferase
MLPYLSCLNFNDTIIQLILERNLKKTIFILLLLISSLYAELKNESLSQKLLDSKIPIVDIRTPSEWLQTGIIKGSIPIMFFNEKGSYNINEFLTKLNAKVDTTKPFALICRTGSRTKVVSTFLSKELNYKVTNITGGIMYPQMKNPPFVRYK